LRECVNDPSLIARDLGAIEPEVFTY
jgi:hypothetical protein